jgi:hypothetical protein
MIPVVICRMRLRGGSPRQTRTGAAAARCCRCARIWAGRGGNGLEQLREAARRGTGTSADARHLQPLLAFAAALVDLRQLGEAEDILRAADNQALQDIPAAAALYLLRGRVHLAAGRLADAAA